MGFSEEGQGLWQPNTHGFVFVTKLLVMLVPDCNQIHSPALKKKKKKHRLAQVRTKKWTWAHIFRGIYLTYSKTLTQLRPNLRNICFSDCQVCPPWKKERKKKKSRFLLLTMCINNYNLRKRSTSGLWPIWLLAYVCNVSIPLPFIYQAYQTWSLIEHIKEEEEMVVLPHLTLQASREFIWDVRDLNWALFSACFS